MKIALLLLLCIAVLIALLRGGVSLGHLPGDITLQLGQNTKVFLPIATCLLLSLLVSLILTILRRR